MKKYLLPSALILAFGLALAAAQTITKSVQLTQDPRSPIGMDASNNTYFPAHVLDLGSAPALTSCGGGTPTIAGSDFGGTVTEGTTSTGCTVTFFAAYAAAPSCVVTSRTAGTPVGYSTATTALTITNTSASSLVADYVCTGQK